MPSCSADTKRWRKATLLAHGSHYRAIPARPAPKAPDASEEKAMTVPATAPFFLLLLITGQCAAVDTGGKFLPPCPGTGVRQTPEGVCPSELTKRTGESGERPPGRLRRKQPRRG